MRRLLLRLEPPRRVVFFAAANPFHLQRLVALLVSGELPAHLRRWASPTALGCWMFYCVCGFYFVLYSPACEV